MQVREISASSSWCLSRSRGGPHGRVLLHRSARNSARGDVRARYDACPAHRLAAQQRLLPALRLRRLQHVAGPAAAVPRRSTTWRTTLKRCASSCAPPVSLAERRCLTSLVQPDAHVSRLGGARRELHGQRADRGARPPSTSTRHGRGARRGRRRRAADLGGGARGGRAGAEVPPSLLENGGAEASCAICMEALLADGETPIRQLPCSHSFHCGCCDPWFLNEHERSCPSCRAASWRWTMPTTTSVAPRPSAYEEFLRLRESGVLAAMIRQHQEQEQERASARSALFEPRAGGQGGVLAYEFYSLRFRRRSRRERPRTCDSHHQSRVRAAPAARQGRRRRHDRRRAPSPPRRAAAAPRSRAVSAKARGSPTGRGARASRAPPTGASSAPRAPPRAARAPLPPLAHGGEVRAHVRIELSGPPRSPHRAPSRRHRDLRAAAERELQRFREYGLGSMLDEDAVLSRRLPCAQKATLETPRQL